MSTMNTTAVAESDLQRWAVLLGMTVDELRSQLQPAQIAELRSLTSLPEFDRRNCLHSRSRPVVRANAEHPDIEGYAAVYYDQRDPEGTEFHLAPDLKERLMPGCFDRAIRERHDTACLLNHNPDVILGRVSAGTLRLSVDSIGLRYHCDPPDNQVGKNVSMSIERGDIRGSSFQFSVLEQTWRWQQEGEGDGEILIREIVDLQLYDVAPVVFPAYRGTSVDLSRASKLAVMAQRMGRNQPARSKLSMAKRKLALLG